MMRVCWWLVDILSPMLDPDERDAVRGDLVESGETGARALCDVSGLVARRQAALWKAWRPWLALIGIVGPVGVLLIQFSFFLSGASQLYLWIIRNYKYIDPALLEQTGLTLRNGISILVCYSALLGCWSWTSGFALGSLSRRTIWVNGALFCIVWLIFSGTLHGIPSLRLSSVPKLPTVLFLLPFIGGVYRGLRSGTLGLRQAIFFATAIASLTAVAIWRGNWWRGGPWQMMLALSLIPSWPVWYMLAIANSRRTTHERDIRSK